VSHPLHRAARIDPMTASVYGCIRDHTQSYQIAPTLREIGLACHVGHTTVLRHLDRLEALGYIEREPGRARSIRLTDKRPPDGDLAPSGGRPLARPISP
jgi:SOS-response transcriptional repressor LexA